MGKVALKEETAVVPAVQSNEPTPILSMLQRIMTDPALPMERVNQAFDFYQRVRADEAQRAYYEAKAAFKAVAPVITKDKDNKQYNSRYASIGNVVNVLNEALSKHGLDASWDFDQTNGIKTTCTLRHILGHSESVSLVGPPDTSGAKNPLQQIKSTLTYLKLATFEGVTGIATREGNADDDGNGSGAAKETITEKQVAELAKAMEAANVEKQIILEHFKVSELSEMTPAQHTTAMNKLKAKNGK